MTMMAARTQNDDRSKKLNMYVAELSLTYRTVSILEKRGIFTVSDLLHCTKKDLLDIKTVGETTLENIFDSLEEIGFYRRK